MSVLIPTYTLEGLEEGKDYTLDYPSLSIDNEFTPIHALNNGTLLKGEDNRKTLMYSLETPLVGFMATNRAEFTEWMSKYDSWGWAKHIIDNSRTYFSMYGTLIHFNPGYNTVAPLVVLAAKNKYLFRINKHNPNYRHFCILVDKNMKAQHRAIFDYVESYFINPMLANGIDVLYTSSIMELCFNPSLYSLPRFQTIEENVNYMKDINRILCESFVREKELLKV